MKIKEIFDSIEGGSLTYEQFMEAAKAGNAKFADVSEGTYVSKRKYEDDINGLNEQLTSLKETISTRDTDLANLQQQLESAGNDATRLGETLDAFSELQTKYEADTKAYQDKLAKQAYHFAVKDFANTKKFTSNAAKRDFIQAMESKGLQMENDVLLGAEDFVKAYSVDNADAFVVDEPPIEAPLPKFVETTPSHDAGRKLSLSEQMQMKNENPSFVVSF